MGKLIDLNTSLDQETLFFIESTEVEGSSKVEQASGYMEKEFDKIMERVNPFCETIIKNFRNLTVQPDTASAEFGLSITAQGNIFVAKASGEASLKITLNWNNQKKTMNHQGHGENDLEITNTKPINSP